MKVYNKIVNFLINNYFWIILLMIINLIFCFIFFSIMNGNVSYFFVVFVFFNGLYELDNFSDWQSYRDGEVVLRDVYKNFGSDEWYVVYW